GQHRAGDPGGGSFLGSELAERPEISAVVGIGRPRARPCAGVVRPVAADAWRRPLFHRAEERPVTRPGLPHGLCLLGYEAAPDRAYVYGLRPCPVRRIRATGPWGD